MTQRIFYYHVPSAWVAYLAFAVTAAASARYLWRPDAAADRLARASAEIGTLFAGIALLTGLLWSRVAFTGAYNPIQDAKVLSLVVLLLSYLGYLSLRSGVEDAARRGRLAAVFGLLAFIGVPLSYLASKLSVHPDFTQPSQGLSRELGMLLGLAVIVFTVLYACLVAERVRLEEIADGILDLEGSA
jgi:heme exporter protein C